jgi:hypothetical protein
MKAPGPEERALAAMKPMWSNSSPGGGSSVDAQQQVLNRVTRLALAQRPRRLLLCGVVALAEFNAATDTGPALRRPSS